MNAHEIDRLSVQIARDVYQQHGVIITAVGIYSRNTSSPEATQIRMEIYELLQNYREVVQMHGFYLDHERKTIKFDIVMTFEAEDRQAEFKEICGRVQEMYPDYRVFINLDDDISD
jgi:hypothetical protein